jgi:putative nucleotidyltransferase with HDIG domain
MSDPVRFLGALAQALSVMTLYPAGHPSRENAVDDAYEELDALAADTTKVSFTFLEDEVVYGTEPLRGLKAWEWGPRLIKAGIERLELQRRASRDEFDRCLEEILARVTLATVDTSESRQMGTLAIRFGAIGLQNDGASQPIGTAATTLELTLGEEADTLRWTQRQVAAGLPMPLVEVEAIVRSLTVAMHGGRGILLPLLQLKEFDQYTTTHSLNVAVLAMGLAEHLKCTPREVRAFGVAGLLHDIGKVRIPLEILIKPGRLTDEERTVIQSHPVEGARLIIQTGERLELAAVVAYEHHIMLDGHGYPALRYHRECAMASRLVHVCDVYDALRTKRPYRDAWSSEKTIAYLTERAGSEFDPALVAAFVAMLGESRTEIRVLHDDCLAPAV